MKVGGTVEYRTAGMDIAANLTQGGQTGGYRELWRFLRELFKEAGDVDRRSDNAVTSAIGRSLTSGDET
jgi:hypothetical protein